MPAGPEAETISIKNAKMSGNPNPMSRTLSWPRESHANNSATGSAASEPPPSRNFAICPRIRRSFFTCGSWVSAGGGVQGGLAYGRTDEFGSEAIENPVHIHDWHATLLHLLGLDHKKLTYRYAGREMRLTDQKGTVVTGLLQQPGKRAT